MSFFNIDFFASWPRFGRVLGPQDGAKLAVLASKNYAGRPLEPSSVRCLLKIASWRAPGSILEAPGLDFGGSGDDFCEIFARFGSGYLEAVPSVIPPTISPGILAIPQAFPPCQWTRRVTKNGQEESPSAKDTKNAKNCQESKELPLIAQNKRWVGGDDPPWGSSIKYFSKKSFQLWGSA